MPIQSLPHHKSVGSDTDRNDYNGPLKICCTIHSLAGGGAERVMAGLTGHLADRNHQVCLLTLDDGSADRHLVDPRVERNCLRLMRVSTSPLDAIRNTRRRITALRSAIAAQQPDVVLSFCDRMNILTLIAAKPLSIPVVAAERNDPKEQKLGTVWETMRRWSYRSAARLIALTERNAESMQSWNRHPIEVIPSAIDAIPAVSKESSPGETSTPPGSTKRRTILGVGRLVDQKGFDRLIKAFLQHAESNPEWDLVIAGEGPDRIELENLYSDSPHRHRIRMPGWQRPIEPLYQQADVFALPSRYEGFPSALLEAMSAGLPAIAIDCPTGPREIIQDGVDGMLVNAETFSEGLAQLMKAPDKRQELGNAARNVVKRYGWPAMVDRYEEVLYSASHGDRKN
ncbi:GalNAc-alpha-(1-_4)-GalNAc-alpha-(1-_3)-diNAcBac-PP-undecaprenol alpha-1,4-N-acetyl-D-galactosaminyltransferase [Roseimaritima multifibrata]|uniref:GalNAc-alpha-(1->4)-GalNAc-alpha-(1->3)-diNAcBac-PP-undecaprenol alpha-1,4-N-acetyl-D-galactosaminyltransferase n=1 Tax=Roseimaritima multifibrata TaxID=1930274 RepID=A0A517MFB4_9BACT|nr:glycosyltransferase family 4 protein [Roseimaritima multifibrata]QDS93582.1 GalNAc-alpha-(1->4)-GalNAc-alpha-(1->3)-diNAcBac-PP-undecaprenol alpha-1,4-N-acetyl-D-galactosaminyltransferase [Roseimaritima multifibrata]